MHTIKQIPEDFIVREVIALEFSPDGKFSYGILEKRDITTEEAIAKLARFFRLPRKAFSYAGTKDKKAVTRQAVSCTRSIGDVSFDRLSLRMVGKGDVPVSLGTNKGNDFEITIRNLEDDGIEDMRKNHGLLEGKKMRFLNLFDQQRFGGMNDEIGLAIIRKDFKKAVSLILESNARENMLIKEHMQKNPRDYIGALRNIPKKILLFYIHALQSRFWNDVALAMQDAPLESLEIVGFATHFSNKRASEEYGTLMKEKGLSARDFVCREIPELSSEGAERKLYATIEKLDIENPEDDDLNAGKKKIRVSFFLEKGSYATMAIASLFQPR